MKTIYIIRGNDNRKRKELAETLLNRAGNWKFGGIWFPQPKQKNLTGIIDALYMGYDSVIVSDFFQKYSEIDVYIKLAFISSLCEVVVFNVGDRDFCEKIPKGTRVTYGNSKRYLEEAA